MCSDFQHCGSKFLFRRFLHAFPVINTNSTNTQKKKNTPEKLNLKFLPLK